MAPALGFKAKNFINQSINQTPDKSPHKGGGKTYQQPNPRNKGASHKKNDHRGKPNLSRPPGRKPNKTPKAI